MITTKKTNIKKFSKTSIDFLKSFSKNVVNSNLQTTENLGKTCYNLTFSNNALKQNFGLTELTLPEEQAHTDVCEKKLDYTGLITFKKAWRYKYYSQNNHRYEYILLVYASDKKVYYNNTFSYNDTLYSVGSFTFNEVPTLIEFRINGADCVGFATSTNDLVVWNCDSAPYAVNTAPKFRSICAHNDRLFAIENGANYVVRYSDTLNPTSWTTSDGQGDGRIDLNDFRGELRKIVSHLDNLYVFRDFGISKITPYSSNKKFLASNVYLSSTKIYSNTICVCGGDICFLCEDGLYKFDGYKVTKIDLDIFNNFKNYLQNNAQTCFFNNKLYISCFINFSNSNVNTIENNCVIQIDLNTLKYTIMYNVNVCGMYAFKDLNFSKLVVCVESLTLGTKLYEMCDGANSQITLDKKWESNKFVVSLLEDVKTLKSIDVKNNYGFSLKITTEKEEKTISVPQNTSVNKIKLNIKGNYFVFKITSSNNSFDISYFKANFVF